MYTTHSLSLHLQMDIQVASRFGYCKQCWNEHWGAYVFLEYAFLYIYAKKQDCRITQQLYYQFFKEPPYCSPQWLYQFAFSPTFLFFFFFPFRTFIICRHFGDGPSEQCEMMLQDNFICISLFTSDIQHLFKCLLTIGVSSLEKYLTRFYSYYLIGLLSY